MRGIEGATFVVSRERVEAIDPSWPAVEVDGGVRVLIDPKAGASPSGNARGR